MTYGEKISHLRKATGMTQEELGKILNVTYQAVSKWERGESLPDFTTMSQIAKVFQVPLSYFEEDGEEKENTLSQSETAVGSVNYIGTCTVCGKMLKEDEEYTASPKIICKSCAEHRKIALQKENEEAARKREYELGKLRREQRGRGIDAQLIISLILALAGYVVLTVFTFLSSSDDQFLFGALTLVCPLALFAIVHVVFDLINDIRNKDDGTDGYTRNLSLIIAGIFAVINVVLFLIMYFTLNNYVYFLVLLGIGAVVSFTFVSQFMWGNVVKEIFTCGGFTFKLPGFIFSLTVESILWMIITKIFLGILSILVFIVTTIFFAVVAMFGSVITFIPSVIIKSVKDKSI